MTALILLRGGGDLASGIALRLHKSGLKVLVSELPQPLAVRRTVSFAEAVYSGNVTVEGLVARLVEREAIQETMQTGILPVMVDPDASILTDPLFNSQDSDSNVTVVVDARLTKHPPKPLPRPVDLHIGVGPGFNAGQNCDAVIETHRSHTMGRVYWRGKTQSDSGLPDGDRRRVLRAPVDGILDSKAEIGAHVEAGDEIAEILPNSRPLQHQDNAPVQVLAPLSGVLRGLIHPGVQVTTGLKIGDVDPRDDPTTCILVSDKSLAIGGGVLEALLSHDKLRASLWD